MTVALETLLGSAPYLAELVRKHADWFAAADKIAPDVALKLALEQVREAGRSASSEAELVPLLRTAKGRIALLAAVSETSGKWTTAQSTAALSDLADAALEAGLDLLMRLAAAKGQIEAASASAATSGLAIFALGKHGGRELNYSSDIDIVAFFDPRLVEMQDRGEATKIFSRIVQRLAALMQDRAGDEYVFRTDLRLRPDPGATPVALSVDAALAYYESRGQNWERAAWIKARPCAGDMRVGEAFITELAPYIWRKHLDFATIADIQAMKRQINISKNVGDIRVAGHNVKLGLGGIREIEFFTQTQQLIAGGRDRSLRVRPTAAALKALADANWISKKAAADLTRTYWWLRAVENRLQMLRDAQTHVMPEAPDEIAVIARLMDQPDLPAFEKAYRAALNLVVGYYSDLFAGGESLAAGEGSLVFTGSDDDPETLETLSRIGFKEPSRAIETVKKWHYGSYAATRAAAARAHLTELLPALLETISEAGNPDDALFRFDQFLSRLPSGVQLFALLRNHANLRSLLVALMASAPRMAEQVIHRAHVMDGLIDPAFADEVRRGLVLRTKIETFLGDARDYQETIDRARIIGQEQIFLISAGLLAGVVDAQRAGMQFTTLAETLLRRLFASVRYEFAKRHGRIPGARVALLAFGKLASHEMTARSDLDFVILYETDETEESDGERPLAASQYFARLTQRLIAAVSAPTSEGVLYETDMRLRPSGNAGPLAASLNAFVQYQRDSAWTWEHLALSRARVAIADAGFGEKIESTIEDVFARPRDVKKTIDDVLAMRALMAKERPPRHAFDLKLASGGLVDLEFIAQSAQLVAREAIAAHQADTATVLRRMGEIGLVPEGARLAEILGIYATVLQVMSAALADPFKDEGWTEAFRELLAQRTNTPNFERLTEDLREMQDEVSAAAARWYERARTLG
ncbi:bifunctional [glutamine synthetase] adenylyltransferase/[glutamine synthetase]-adenylyl-L-tyrosine phosphorylase [Devosia sp.]|uniref:bifunctional [glutamine synthetase] adenylyltransferase/[glutamine synthetase]-adenylyl-L-tyrosine phosphorylase n=1 Tax=Devosia sp. TaxID=1871048 RepID=UPI003BACA202